jgi:hypothetical protein
MVHPAGPAAYGPNAAPVPDPSTQRGPERVGGRGLEIRFVREVEP